MDYCEGGDLSGKIKKARAESTTFSQEQILRWFTQCVLALKYIHDQHILHRDLKSGNFFLSKSGNIKMGDFGIASPYSWSSDIWSMGCILYEMCALKVPFDAPDLKTLIKKITQGPTPELPASFSEFLRQLCAEMLHR